MNLREVINENAVAVNVKAQNKEEVFECVCDLLLKDGSITSKEEFKQDLYIRESQGKTGIGDGIAIPHGKSLAVKRNCISVLKLERPIQWRRWMAGPRRCSSYLPSIKGIRMTTSCDSWPAWPRSWHRKGLAEN